MAEERDYIDVLEELIDLGILGEGVQEFDHTRWPVLKPDLLPQGFRGHYELYGEIRSD